ncbi:MULTISPECIES: hypothetical protein [unclassified Methylobacterium]|uniref:hypothetical protein n=1 Tax=unclassified Methylobacterium TaxID=2615210 RepID=UPI0012372A8B|nr:MULTISPECIES: hypothetical protein [Methylobacterium]WFT83417.1 hypothetical protein QA634_16965 [Methylobacterium nodulans]
MSGRRDKTQGTPGEPMEPETLEEFVLLGRGLAAQVAEDTFHRITAAPDWSIAGVEAKADAALSRIDLSARDMIRARGADPDGEHWSELWSAMERGYREKMIELTRAAGPRSGGSLQ